MRRRRRSSGDAVGARLRLERAGVPERAAQSARAGRRAGLREPVEVGLTRLGGVDDDVAVLVARLGRGRPGPAGASTACRRSGRAAPRT